MKTLLRAAIGRLRRRDRSGSQPSVLRGAAGPIQPQGGSATNPGDIDRMIEIAVTATITRTGPPVPAMTEIWREAGDMPDDFRVSAEALRIGASEARILCRPG